ncbi:MAG: HEAT repeat domain-containing protein [Planctomycetes bacterium]|nr:HEAT repeat domain-containing protein [Planctomycetota bacterium]
MMKNIVLLAVCLLTACVVSCFGPPPGTPPSQPSEAGIGFWIAKLKGVDPDMLSPRQRELKEKTLTRAWTHLVAAGPSAAKQIKRELDDNPDDKYFQLSASMVLYLIEEADAYPAIVEALQRTSIHDNPFQYFHLCHRLARSRDKSVLPVLERLLADETVTVVIDANMPVLEAKMIPAYLYGVFGPKSIGALKKACNAENPTVRANAAALLGYFGDDDPLPALVRLLNNDPDENVRCIAATALGKIDNPTVASYLAEMLAKDDNPNVRAACADGLGKLQHEKSLDGLVVALNDSSPQVRQVAAAGLEHIGTERCSDIVARRLAIEKDTDVRRLLIKVLGLMGQKKWGPLLKGVSEKGSPDEASAASLAIQRIAVGGPRTREPYPDLEGESVQPAELEKILTGLFENYGEGISRHKKTIFLSADASHLEQLEELRCRVLWFVNDQTMPRVGEVSELISLVRRKSRDML